MSQPFLQDDFLRRSDDRWRFGGMEVVSDSAVERGTAYMLAPRHDGETVEEWARRCCKVTNVSHETFPPR